MVIEHTLYLSYSKSNFIYFYSIKASILIVPDPTRFVYFEFLNKLNVS